MKIRHSEPYGPLRKAAYPEIGEQLDALVKLAASLREQGVQLPDKVNSWIDRCADVKRRYPKPQ